MRTITLTNQILVAGALLLLGAGLALAEPFGRESKESFPGTNTAQAFIVMDTNSDGKVTIEEYRGHHVMKETFEQLDTNGDGVLTLKEYANGNLKSATK